MFGKVPRERPYDPETTTGMRTGVVMSSVLHLAIIAVGYIGVPLLFAPAPLVEDTPIPIEILIVEARTVLPDVRPSREKPTPPKPKARASEAPPPPPPPKPSKAPEPPKVALAPTPPTPELAPRAKPKPMPKLEPAPPPVLTPPPVAEVREPPRPKAKPNPPKEYSFSSVLKSVEELRDEQRPKENVTPERVEPTPPEPQPQQVARATPQPRPTPPVELGNQMTTSEIDAVRQQIERCWNVPIGARDARDLVIDIQVHLNPDGTVRRAIIMDRSRLQRDSFFRAAAESARRAVLQCSPLTLPMTKYDHWQTIHLSFNPRDMFGT